MKELFITFEGIDGCGKTTQAERLAAYVSSRGRDIVLTREPGGTSVSEKIRTILLDRANDGMMWLTEMFLYMASRAQHTEQIIRPALQNGVMVISDRYMDATLAYQGYGRGLDRKVIRGLNSVATSGLVPHLTFLIDLDPKTCCRRMAGMNKKADRLETAGLDFQKRVREGYLEIATEEAARFRVLDGARGIDELEHEVQRMVEPFL